MTPTDTLTHLEARATVAPLSPLLVDMLQADDFEAVTHGPCRLSFNGTSWIMTGPSGAHCLAAGPATDCTRLSAHWEIFASHPQNRS
jgi:hypothetical protein